MDDATEPKDTIYGSFPLPSTNEIDEALSQIVRRIERAPELLGISSGSIEQMAQAVRYLQECPSLGQRLEELAANRAKTVDDDPRIRGSYLNGCLDVLEILLTVAMNREAKAVMEAIEPATDD